MEVNVLNLGMTRLTQSYDGVHHWHGTTRNAVIVQSFGGVFARLRNAYYHDILARWFLLDKDQPGWMERLNLDGTVETFFAPPTGDDAVEPVFTRVTLSEATKMTLFTDVEVTGQLISTKTGAPPFEVASTEWVENLNADRVDSLHATLLPEANTLLALDNNSKWPNSTLYMGHTFGIDSDTVDGKHFSDIQAEIDLRTNWKYVSAWTTMNSGTTTFTHNLNQIFKEIGIWVRPGTSGDATSMIHLPIWISFTESSRGNTTTIKSWFPNLNSISINIVNDGLADPKIGYNASGTLITAGAGQYQVYAR